MDPRDYAASATIRLQFFEALVARFDSEQQHDQDLQNQQADYQVQYPRHAMGLEEKDDDERRDDRGAMSEGIADARGSRRTSVGNSSGI